MFNRFYKPFKVNTSIFCICTTIFLYPFLNFNTFSRAESINNQSTLKTKKRDLINLNYLNNKKNQEYIIGPGDKLQINFSDDYPELSRQVSINSEGTINIPKINEIYVEGLTLRELNELLNKALKKYINFPSLSSDIFAYRPIKVMMTGEVRNPGLHVLDGEVRNTSDKTSYFPTLYDAISQAGGLTRYSDLSQIEVLRINNLSNGGGYIKTKLDLNRLFTGDFETNIRIFDGDSIKINRVKDPNDKLSLRNMQMNLNPKQINIYISGRVVNQGLISVPTFSSLNDAIMIANGKKVISGPITFVRFNSDGTTLKKKIKYKSKAKSGSNNNPKLMNNDLIFVGNNAFNNTTEFLNEITSPFQGLVSVYGLIKIIGD